MLDSAMFEAYGYDLQNAIWERLKLIVDMTYVIYATPKKLASVM